MSSPTPHSQGSGRSYSHSGRSTPPQPPSLSLFGRSATQRSGPLRPELPPPPPPPLLSPSSSFLSSPSTSASGSGRFAGMMSVSLTSVARTPTTTTPTTTTADSPQTLTPPTRKLTDSLRSLFSRKSTKRQASVSSASSVKSSFSLRAPGSTSEDFARFFPHLASAPMAEKASADDESDKGFYAITVYSYPDSETLKISHSFDGQEIRSEIMQAFGLKMGDAYQIFDAKHYSTSSHKGLSDNELFDICRSSPNLILRPTETPAIEEDFEQSTLPSDASQDIHRVKPPLAPIITSNKPLPSLPLPSKTTTPVTSIPLPVPTDSTTPKPKLNLQTNTPILETPTTSSPTSYTGKTSFPFPLEAAVNSDTLNSKKSSLDAVTPRPKDPPILIHTNSLPHISFTQTEPPTPTTPSTARAKQLLQRSTTKKDKKKLLAPTADGTPSYVTMPRKPRPALLTPTGVRIDSLDRPTPSNIIEHLPDFFPNIKLDDRTDSMLISAAEAAGHEQIEDEKLGLTLSRHGVEKMSDGTLLVNRGTVNRLHENSVKSLGRPVTLTRAVAGDGTLSRVGGGGTLKGGELSVKFGALPRKPKVFLTLDRSEIPLPPVTTEDDGKEGLRIQEEPMEEEEFVIPESDAAIEWRRKLTEKGMLDGGIFISVEGQTSVQEDVTVEELDVIEDDQPLLDRAPSRKVLAQYVTRPIVISPTDHLPMDDLIPEVESPDAIVPGLEGFTRNQIIWQKGKLIGSGSFGRVYYGVNLTTHELMAVKQTELVPLNVRSSQSLRNRNQKLLEALQVEISLLKELDHPNVVSYLGFDVNINTVSVFLEYVDGGSLASILSKFGKFPYPMTQSFTWQILHGLEYLHERFIIHRDIKGANILVTHHGEVKIADFGISKKIDIKSVPNAQLSLQGTLYWMAPEVMQNTGVGYTSKVDIWSLGCVVYEMLEGHHPWSGMSDVSIMVNVGREHKAPVLSADIALSENEKAAVNEFLGLCFTADPEKRPTASNLFGYKFLDFTIPDELGFDFEQWLDVKTKEKEAMEAIMEEDSDFYDSSEVEE